MTYKKTAVAIAVMMTLAMTSCGTNTATDNVQINDSISEYASGADDGNAADQENDEAPETEAETESETEAQEAADGLTDNLCDLRLLAGDNLISLPCTLSSLEESGWVHQQDYPLGGAKVNASNRIRYEKDGFFIDFDICNKSEEDIASFDGNQDKLTVQGLNYAAENNTKSVELPRGFKVPESTRKDVMDTYGEPGYSNGSYLVYSDDTDTANRRVMFTTGTDSEGKPIIESIFLDYTKVQK